MLDGMTDATIRHSPALGSVVDFFTRDSEQRPLRRALYADSWIVRGPNYVYDSYGEKEFLATFQRAESIEEIKRRRDELFKELELLNKREVELVIPRRPTRTTRVL